MKKFNKEIFIKFIENMKLLCSPFIDKINVRKLYDNILNIKKSINNKKNT